MRRSAALAAGSALSGLLLVAITAFMPAYGGINDRDLNYGLPFGFVVTHPHVNAGALFGYFSWIPSKDEAHLAVAPFAASWLFWTTVSAFVLIAMCRWWRRIATTPR